VFDFYRYTTEEQYIRRSIPAFEAHLSFPHKSSIPTNLLIHQNTNQYRNISPPTCQARLHMMVRLDCDARSKLDDNCGICLEKMQVAPIQTECQHIFHESCIIKWLRHLSNTKGGGTCPCWRNQHFVKEEQPPKRDPEMARTMLYQWF
jgi:hypothetical protein